MRVAATRTAGRRRALARARALLVDVLLLAYVAWATSLLQASLAGATPERGWLLHPAGWLGARPWLLLVVPFLARLLQALDLSPGERLVGVDLEGPDGERADGDRRALRALVAALHTAVALAPLGMAVVRCERGGDGRLHALLALLLAACFLAAGLVDRAGRGLADLLVGTRPTRRAPAGAEAVPPPHRRPGLVAAVLVVLLSLAVGAAVAEISLGALFAGWEDTRGLLGRLLDPDWSIAERVLEKMVETVFLALMASVLALPAAVVLGFLGARNLMRGRVAGRAVYALVRVVLNVVRSVEPIIWVIVFSLWVGVGPFAGVLALLVHSIAALGKLYSEAVEGVDRGPVEAIVATGARPIQVARHGVLPQVLPPFLAFTLYRWDINVRMATILGLVGGGGIGDLLIAYQQLGAWSKVGTIIVFVTAVVWLLDWVSSRARARLG